MRGREKKREAGTTCSALALLFCQRAAGTGDAAGHGEQDRLGGREDIQADARSLWPGCPSANRAVVQEQPVESDGDGSKDGAWGGAEVPRRSRGRRWSGHGLCCPRGMAGSSAQELDSSAGATPLTPAVMERGTAPAVTPQSQLSRAPGRVPAKPLGPRAVPQQAAPFMEVGTALRGHGVHAARLPGISEARLAGYVLSQLLAPAPSPGPVAMPLQPLCHPSSPSRGSRDGAQQGSR